MTTTERPRTERTTARPTARLAAEDPAPLRWATEPGSAPLIEITQLALHRPTADATDAEVAAWYEAKARTHELLAATARTSTEAAAESAYAMAAHDHARRLLTAAVTATPTTPTAAATNTHNTTGRWTR